MKIIRQAKPEPKVSKRQAAPLMKKLVAEYAKQRVEGRI